MAEQAFIPNRVISQLLQSHHGNFNPYINPVMEMGNTNPEFVSKLITWNTKKGEIRDTKVALPIISLRTFAKDDKEFAENAVANLLMMDPRSIVKAYEFNKQLTKDGKNIPG